MNNQPEAPANATPVRILHLLPTLEYGGIAMMLRNFYRYIDRSQRQFDFVHFGREMPYHEELRQMGARIFTVSPIAKTGLIGYMRQMRRLFRENGPFEVVHIHLNYMSGVAALVARCSGIKKRICHIRGEFIESGKVKLLLPFFRLLIRMNATKLLSVNENCGKFYYGNQSFTIIHNAVDLDEYLRQPQEQRAATRAALGLADNEIAIGHVARFTVEKNHAFLLDVARALQSRGAAFRFCFAGDGPLLEQTKQLFADAGLTEYALFLGNRPDVPALMHAFDVTVLPSISEGLPNVVMQSQAAGTPCVLSDKLTREVEVGLGLLTYCQPGNPAAWADDILAAASKGKQAPGCIREAFVASGFEIHASVARLERIYADG